jgi:tetratricopeptide (TPR) repeat protein
VRIDGVLEAESGRTPGVEGGIWRLQVPPFSGSRTLVISLVATPRAGAPRLRLVPSSACSFGVDPFPSVNARRPLPAWLAPFAGLVVATLDASAGSFSGPRSLLAGITSGKPRFMLARALFARMILADPSLLPETARRLALLQTAAFPGDGWSLFEQARIAEVDGRPEQAMEKLSRLDSAWAIVARARLALETSDVPTAGDTGDAKFGSPLAGLLVSSRHHRVFLTAAAAVRRRDPRLALAYLKPALALRPDLPDLLQFHLQTQQFPEALAEGLRLFTAGYLNETLLSSLGSACLGLRNLEGALQWNDQRLADDPGSEPAFLRRLDVLTALGHDPAGLFRELAAHVARFPYHRDTLLLYWASPSFRQTTLPDLKALLDLNWGKDAPAVFLLNREEHFLSSRGGAFVRVTRWVRLNTPVAVEELGELELPSDALILDVRTLKADGTVYPPSSTPQKSSFSLRNLEPGDIVIFSYLRVNAPVPGLPGRTWGPRFQLSHRAFPTVLAEWVVHAPLDLPLVLRPEGRLPEIQRTIDADGVHLKLQSWTGDRLPSELRMAHFVAPSIQMHAGFSEEDLYALFAEETPWPDWDSLELAQLARQLCPRPGAACVPDTARWVLRQIRDDRQLTRAAHILQRRAGSRIHLLFALLRHQGYHPRMLLARASRTSDGPIAWPDPAEFPIWLLDVPGFGFIDTRFSHLPPGRMVPAVGGSEAVVLSPRPTTVRLGPASPQSRTLEARARISQDQSANFEIHEVSSGFHAVQKLDTFARLSPEALREQIQVDSLQRYFPGSRLLSLDWKRPPADREELTATYTFWAPSVCAPADGKNLELRRFPFPWNLRRRFGVFLPRTTDFLPNALPYTRLELTIEPPAGMMVEASPELKLETEFGRLHRRLVPGPGRSARLILEKSLRPEVIPVARWKAFSAFVQLFDEYETLPVVLVPVR